MPASKIRLTFRAFIYAPDTLADHLEPDIAAIEPGAKLELIVNDVGFTVYYDAHQAHGDNGQPVPGDVTGDYEAHIGVDGPFGLRRLTDVHVSPHGTSGYGNPAAKSYAARKVALAIAQYALRHPATKEQS